MYLITCTRPDLAYPLSLLARYVAPGRHQKVHWDAAKRVVRYLCSTSGMGLGYTFSLGSSSISWQSTRSSSILSSSCEAEIYTGAMAAQELRWLTYLLTDLGEAPHSPPVLYQRGQLRLAYMASRANTADVFTKALQPCDHQPPSPRAPVVREQPLPHAPPVAREQPLPRAPPAAHEQPLPRAPLLPTSNLLAAHSPCLRTPRCSARQRDLQPSAPACPAAHSASATCCPAHRRTPQPSAPYLAEPRRPGRAALPIPSRAALPHSPAPPSRPATAGSAGGAAGGAGGAAGSAGGAAGSAGGAARSVGGAAGSSGGAGGAAGSAGGAATECHCLSWPLSRSSQRLGVDSSSHCLFRTTPPLSSFVSGLFSKAVLVVEVFALWVLHSSGSSACRAPSPCSGFTTVLLSDASLVV
ncbi:unnamed protein product [Closterium sp. NIES-53]